MFFPLARPMKSADKPTILIDSREQTPLDFEGLLPSKSASLYTGDYSIKGFEHDFAVERKSLGDLASSICLKRFEKELHRLRGFKFKRLLIVGSVRDAREGKYFSKLPPKALFAKLSAFEVRYDIPIAWESNRSHAARIVARWAWFYYREAAMPFKRVEACEIVQPEMPAKMTVQAC